MNNEYDINNQGFNEEMSGNVNNYNNSSVFERLHTTSIRNKRTHILNNSFNNELNNSFGNDTIMNDENNNDNHNHNHNNGVFNEGSRVISSQTEISKKPQRNTNNNNNAKSLLMNPVRVLTPDDQ